jgi:thioredoxin reductase
MLALALAGGAAAIMTAQAQIKSLEIIAPAEPDGDFGEQTRIEGILKDTGLIQ